ncbi:WD40-repeat-containing domain protein [Panaeolus papilionaceus]|nr:WD40-repeat-containing domain protein [Panaeolus papilionaceus]
MEIDPDIEHNSSWFADPNKPHPFKLVRSITNKSSRFSFHSTAIFPWKEDSLKVLWSGDALTAEPPLVDKWKAIVDKHWDMVAVGSRDTLFIFHTHKPLPPVVVQLKPQNAVKLIKADRMHTAWSLDRDNLEPVVIFNHASNIYIYNVISQSITGSIRGHGGAVTSISVHPVDPQYFCSTSRDFTTRIYSLMLEDDPPRQRRKKPSPNPHWPPSTKPSLAGAAHGLRLSPQEIEGHGIGRCIGVLMGGRSGGHNAAVMAAAFHPSHPLIATCGMDRAVKIWFFRYPKSKLEAERLAREDKPLFSTQRIHKARVLSITWLLQDVLVTHSAPSIMKCKPGDPEDKRVYQEAGEISVWQWLGFDRFFPAQFQDARPQTLRGCSSDYQESSSFKILSTYAFPNPETQYVAPSVNIFQYELPERDYNTNKPYGHDPLALIVHPFSQHIDLVNIALFQPRAVPHVVPGANQQSEEEDQLSEAERDDVDFPLAFNPRKGMAPPLLQGWRIRAPSSLPASGVGHPPLSASMDQNNGQNTVMLPDCSEDEDDDPDVPHPGRIPKLMSCSMGVDGQMLVGVGTKGSLWVWTYDAEKEAQIFR